MKQQTLADRITGKLETMILEGVYKPGDRLPPERKLAEQLEVSRPSLRTALKTLAAKGILRSRQGGGHYITDILTRSVTNPLVDILGKHPNAQDDVLEFRVLLEGTCAFYAAQRATEEDKQNLQKAFRLLEESTGTDQESQADLAFHLAIAEASHNIILLQAMRGIFSLLEHNIAANIGGMYNNQETGTQLLQQHRDIMAAILAGQAEQARLAAEEHVIYVRVTLAGEDKKQIRQLRARRRAGSLEAI
ncbi:FCD domain-containing protein [Endozoicomonas sp. 2B-B]